MVGSVPTHMHITLNTLGYCAQCGGLRIRAPGSDHPPHGESRSRGGTPGLRRRGVLTGIPQRFLQRFAICRRLASRVVGAVFFYGASGFCRDFAFAVRRC
jgi:hypothetical protein